ncbi:hypothetical protein SLEP1_g18779 [Rubroshorea leprosula]|uniref:Uncharacterized protein n=1 Tax=Rubroshorea leprosula TaxID=152421 RepID=A0AAV5J7T2_9ROSI|nr:hypothetical protein SLEP1_g18779 [Rubroshorea leprosula]
MEGNPSKSTIMAPVAQDITEIGVDPIVRSDLRNSPTTVEAMRISLSVLKKRSWSSNAFKNAASKNNTSFIASILLTPAPPNPSPIPIAEIMKGGETGNAARNATIASMRRKPRSAQLLFVQGFRAGVDQREQRKVVAKNVREMLEESRRK